MNNPPVGVELDAAVLRILGWKFVEGFTNIHMTVPDKWVIPDEHTCRYLDYDFISTDPNGHEALRLCGPWLDERCEWSVSFYLMAELSDHRHVASAYDRNLNFFKVRCATRAEAICRLVLAIAEREGT